MAGDYQRTERTMLLQDILPARPIPSQTTWSPRRRTKRGLHRSLWQISVEVCVSFIQADQHFLCAFEDTPHQCDLMLLLLYVGLVDTECIDPHQLSVLQLA
jgi:hypothetical protein